MSISCFEFIAGATAEPIGDAALDIVFIHGLTGDHLETWTHDNGQFWPKWLADDFPNINVYSAGYESSVFGHIIKGDGASLADRATMLIEQVISRKPPRRKVLFIAHSLGGLIVKQLLRRCSDATSGRRKVLGLDVIGVIFLGTPHVGTSFAKSFSSVISTWTSQNVKELSHGADALLDLGQWFSGWAAERAIRVEAYYEVEKYKSVLVVDQVTANPHVPGCDPIALPANHVELAKLESKEAPLYVSLTSVLHDILGGLAQAPLESLEDLIDGEYKILTAHADDDRRSLADKLTAAGRAHSISRAERQKERFSKVLQRNIAQPSAVKRNTRLMSSIETRFHRYVTPAIVSGRSNAEIEAIIQEQVLDPALSRCVQEGDEVTAGTVDSALYYLAGNCHIGWDA